VIVLNLLLAWVGQLPGREVVLPATLVLAAAGAVLLLRATAAWSDVHGPHVSGAADSRARAGSADDRSSDAGSAWRSALETGQALSVRDWSGSLLLIAALIGAVVFVWMLAALFVVVPGILILASAAVKMRSSRA
jgi:hypothetical protein